MSISDGYRADVEDVRQYQHLPDWDPTGIPDEAIEAYIDDANLLVDEELANTDQSDRRLAKLEALIAAHYLASSNIDAVRQSEREGSADGASTWYGPPQEAGMAFEETTMGRRALAEDRSGRLQALIDNRDEFWSVTYSG